MSILGVDVGTTGLKMGVFDIFGDALLLTKSFSKEYDINIYNEGLFADIEPEKWRRAFADGCKSMSNELGEVEVIALAGTTPGLTAMDAQGEALYPAILMLDQRSRKQAQQIIDTVGLENLMAATGNMPVAGGCSLASILWIKESLPEIFNKTYMFGHSNTYMASWLTGEFAIDPSSASLTSLYNTASFDFTWNDSIAKSFGILTSKLPELIPSYESAGNVKQLIADQLGFRKQPPVLIGGNDAVLAAYSMGIENPGDVINVNGTCEISLVCLPECIASVNYNVRTHVIPNRWLTLYVMNAGGKALEWFKGLFCREMSDEVFYSDFLPLAVDSWLDRESTVTYVPYLMGSRYSQEPLKAEFLGLTHETTREELAAAIVRGLCKYQGRHLNEVGQRVPISHTVYLTGGALNDAIIRAKRKWMLDADYVFNEQSSMKGAALLGRRYIEA